MQGQLTHRLRGQDGQASVEFLGALPLLFAGALLVAQLLLVGSSMTSAQNAARTGSRAASLHSDGSKAALAALRPGLRKDSKITVAGTSVRVQIRVPTIVPGLDLPLTLAETATLPRT